MNLKTRIEKIEQQITAATPNDTRVRPGAVAAIRALFATTPDDEREQMTAYLIKRFEKNEVK